LQAIENDTDATEVGTNVKVDPEENVSTKIC